MPKPTSWSQPPNCVTPWRSDVRFGENATNYSVVRETSRAVVGEQVRRDEATQCERSDSTAWQGRAPPPRYHHCYYSMRGSLAGRSALSRGGWPRGADGKSRLQ